MTTALMRIAFIHPSWPGDEGTGATHTATQVITGLANRGHDVRVYCSKTVPNNVEIDIDVEITQLSFSGSPYHTNTQLNRGLRERQGEFDTFDITHCYLPAGLPAMEAIGEKTSSVTGLTLNAYGAICPKNDLLYMGSEQCTTNSLGRCTNCIVQTSPGHDEFSTPYRIASRLGNLRLIRQSTPRSPDIDFFRSPSEHVKTNYSNFGFPVDKIHVIPHPLNSDFLVEHESDFSEPYRLLYVGYLQKQKGVEKLVPVLAGLREQLDQKSRLTIIGNGGLRSAIIDQAREYDIQDAVDIRGFVPNKQLPSVYSSHDMFVYPGIWEEPLARVYLEALAAGLPVVTSEYGSVESIVGDGGVTTDGSVSAFISTIGDLIKQDRLGVLSEGAQSTAQRYRVDKVIPRIEEIYHSEMV